MTTPLEKFKEEVRCGPDRNLLGRGCWAYRMDGQPGMRESAGLGGGLACCDYLRVDHRVVLIEETQLAATILRLAKEECRHSADDEGERREFAWNYIREWVAGENCKKACGAFLVLFCMRVQLDDMRREFWIVDSSRQGVMRAMRAWNRGKELESEIKKRLGDWVNQVEVITPDALRRRLTGGG